MGEISPQANFVLILSSCGKTIAVLLFVNLLFVNTVTYNFSALHNKGSYVLSITVIQHNDTETFNSFTVKDRRTISPKTLNC